MAIDAKAVDAQNNALGAVVWRVSSDLDDSISTVVTNEAPNKITVIGLSSQSAKLVGNYAPIIAQVKGVPGIASVLNIRLTKGLAPGPIPPGLDAQVDLMWAVVPQNIVGDNFGHAIRKKFYAIEVVIGNNTGYDLQIASVGFEGSRVPDPNGRNGEFLEIDHVAPSTGFKMARGSSERAKELYPRNLALNTIRALGPVLVGFSPFFKNVGHRSNFAQGINIFSDPFEKAFDLVVPDLSVEELNRLQDAVIRDDNMTRTVVPNNTQARTVVLVPKELLRLRKEDGRDVPLKVMKALGKLVLIGNRVQFLNRERVVALPTTKGEYGISGKITDECDNGIPGVNVTLNGPADFPQRSVTTNEDGKFSFGEVPSGDKYTVTPKLGDKDMFTPTNGSTDPKGSGLQTFTLDEEKSKVDFTASLDLYKISGKVTGDLISGVKIILNEKTDTSVTTGSDGSYSLTNVPKDQFNKVSVELTTEQKNTYVASPAESDPFPKNCNKKDVNFSVTKKKT